MKVSCGEGIASHTGPESCGDDRKVVVEALTGERAGRVLSPEILIVRDADALMSCGRLYRPIRQREDREGPAGSKTPSTHRSISRGSREIPGLAPTPVGVRAVNLKRERRR
jgi:RNA-directed DNA polymerase